MYDLETTTLCHALARSNQDQIAHDAMTPSQCLQFCSTGTRGQAATFAALEDGRFIWDQSFAYKAKRN